MMNRKVPHLSHKKIRSTNTKKTWNTGRNTGCLLLFLVIMLVMPATALSSENSKNLNIVTTGKNFPSSIPASIQNEIESEIAADKSTESVVENEEHSD